MAAVLWRKRHKNLEHGLRETEADHDEVEAGTFAATFFLACLAAMELEGVALDEI
jgi:hypothetical protein